MTKGWESVKGRFTHDHRYGLKLTLSLTILLLALFSFGMIVEGWVNRGSLYYLDFKVQRLVEGIVTPTLTIFMTHITFLGTTNFTWGLAGLVVVILLLKKEWWPILSLQMILWVGKFLLAFLKEFFHRARPMPQIVSTPGYSFPSGHSFYAMLVYGFMIYLTWKFIRNNCLRSLIFFICILLILLIGFSRIYLNVHWLTDVLGGYSAAFSWLMINILAVEIIKHRWQARRSKRRQEVRTA
ncbi:MAG: phosphatase PAP2 family protein [Desulfobaccales bacterium]